MVNPKFVSTAKACGLSSAAGVVCIGCYSVVMLILKQWAGPQLAKVNEALRGSQQIDQASVDFQQALYFSHQPIAAATRLGSPPFERTVFYCIILSLLILLLHGSVVVVVHKILRERTKRLSITTALERLLALATTRGLLYWGLPIWACLGFALAGGHILGYATPSRTADLTLLPPLKLLPVAAAIFACLDFVLTASWLAKRVMIETTETAFCRSCGYEISRGRSRRCPECGTLHQVGERGPIPLFGAVEFHRIGRVAYAGFLCMTAAVTCVVIINPWHAYSYVHARALAQNPWLDTRKVFVIPEGRLLVIETEFERVSLLATPNQTQGIDIEVRRWTKDGTVWCAASTHHHSFPTQADAFRGGEIPTGGLRIGYSGSPTGVGLVYALSDVVSARFSEPDLRLGRSAAWPGRL